MEILIFGQYRPDKGRALSCSDVTRRLRGAITVYHCIPIREDCRQIRVKLTDRDGIWLLVLAMMQGPLFR